MRFTSKLTDADFDDLQKLTNKTFWMDPAKVVIEYVLATLGLWSSLKVYLHRAPSIWPIDAAIGLLVAGSVTWLLFRRKQKRIEELARLNAARPNHLDLANEGITYDGFNGTETLVPWIKFKSWREGHRVILVERTAGGFVILPVSRLPEVERTLVRHLLQSNLEALKTHSNYVPNFTNAPTTLNAKSLLRAMGWFFLVVWAVGMLFEIPFLYLFNPKWATDRLITQAEIMWWMCFLLSMGAFVGQGCVGWGKVDPNGPKSLSEAIRKEQDPHNRPRGRHVRHSSRSERY